MCLYISRNIYVKTAPVTKTSDIKTPIVIATFFPEEKKQIWKVRLLKAPWCRYSYCISYRFKGYSRFLFLYFFIAAI